MNDYINLNAISQVAESDNFNTVDVSTMKQDSNLASSTSRVDALVNNASSMF